MPDSKPLVAIEITNRELADVAIALDPTLAELDYETDLKNCFLVFGHYETFGRYAIVRPENFLEFYDHIENGPEITLKMFHKK